MTPDSLKILNTKAHFKTESHGMCTGLIHWEVAAVPFLDWKPRVQMVLNNFNAML